jgi:hypothetical protein
MRRLADVLLVAYLIAAVAAGYAVIHLLARLDVAVADRESDERCRACERRCPPAVERLWN